MIATSPSTGELYQQRLDRYVTAMRRGRPDRIPIRPFAAEFTANYAGYTCQQITHDYNNAFEAVLKTCAAFDWDAVVPSMVWVWTGLTEAIGLNYYGVPGIHIEPDMGFQYREPPEERSFMKREEYDRLIKDPTRLLYEVWLPRVADPVSAEGTPTSYRNNLSLVKGAMAMSAYFNAFGGQIERLRQETGTVSGIAGMLKAPLDILADKLRGYVGLAMDLKLMPEKVLEACRALQPHLEYLALSSVDPEKNLPIPIWMHRSCVPFISCEHFDKIAWPTLKPIVEAIWARGNQVLFYAEGKWDGHLERFAELPAGSIVFHIDQSDPHEVKETFGGKFALSGGVPNYLLGIGTPEQVRAKCKEMIDLLATDGGYIMDASAIIQNDATVENMRAMTEATIEYGSYGSAAQPVPDAPAGADVESNGTPAAQVKPGVCTPWAERVPELPPLSGDPNLVKRIWEDVDGMAYSYIWQVLLSF